MKGKSLVAACLILLLSVLSLGTYLLANDAKLNVDSYGFLQAHNNQLRVQLGQQLFWLDDQERLLRQLDLTKLGINSHGDIAEFANGDVLVYHRDQAPSLSQKLLSFLRIKDDAPRAAKGEEGFKRCNATTCTSFTSALPAFNGAFRLAIEAESQHVHAANTREFRLYLLDQYGQLLAKSDTHHLRFPNQLALQGDKLWVVDTNHHRLAQLNSSITGYGHIERSIKTPQSGNHRWPHQITWDGQHWWINLGNNSLSQGRIIKINEQGELLDELQATELADPLALQWFAASLWVADNQSIKLLRFDGQGNALTTTLPEALQALERRSQKLAHQWQMLAYLALGTFILVLLGGFYAAWQLERKQTKEVLKRNLSQDPAPWVAQATSPLAKGQVLWLNNRLNSAKPWLFLACLVAALLFAGSVSYLLLESNDASRSLIGMCYAALAILVICMWQVQRLSEQRLGVSESFFILEQSPTRSVSLRPEEISYNAEHLSGGPATIALSNGAFAYFDRDELKQHVFPRLKTARQVSPWTMLRLLANTRHPQITALLWVMAAALPLIAWWLVEVLRQIG